MTEQGLKVPTAFSKADGFLSQSKHDDTWALSIGDQISLYMDTDSGYAFMSAGGIENYNARCNAVETASKNQLPSNFKGMMFMLLMMLKITCCCYCVNRMCVCCL